jgi:hypothetical protein
MTYIQINGAASVPEELSTSAAFTTSDTTVMSVTTTRQGFWAAWFRGTYTEGASGGPLTYRLTVGGSVVDSATADSSGTATGSAVTGLKYDGGVLPAGTVIAITGMKGNAGDTASGALVAAFIPTPDYPK